MVLSADQVARFGVYFSLLDQWNQKINLTAIRDAERVMTHHFVDSLAVIACLHGLADLDDEDGSPVVNLDALRLVDVGSGAGFPGAVCALMCPHWSVMLVERVRKKTSFLHALRRELGLQYEVFTGDVKNMVGDYDVAVSRATFAPTEWVKTGLGLVRSGGLVMAMLQNDQHVDMVSKDDPAPVVLPGFPYLVGRDVHRVFSIKK